MKTPDKDWYIGESKRHKLKTSCPIAHCEKCPRYYLSLKLMDSRFTGALDIGVEARQRIESKWETSEAFSCNDESAGISLRDNAVKGVDGFCPEVTAIYFGLYCGELRNFVDEDHRNTAHRQLRAEHADVGDPRWRWDTVIPKHFTNCKEYSVHFTGSPTWSTRRKSNRATISTKLRWEIFERDGFKCQYCGAKGSSDYPLQIDHRVSLADGGSDEPENLVTACEKCNNGKGAKSVRL